jgi:dTDP-4-amino-4,6-dideoxygalactose transaminase
MIKLPHSFPFIDPVAASTCLASLEAGMIGYQSGLNDQIVEAVKRIFPYKEVKITPSASLGLMFLFKSIGLGSEHEVVLSAINCPSVYRSIVAEGANPVICDVRSTVDFRASLETIETVITERTRCIILTHMFGFQLENTIMHELKTRYPDVVLIEDFATTIPRATLDVIYSDYALLSFGSTKPISAGIGGAILCQSPCFSGSYDVLNDNLAFNIKLSTLDQQLLLSALHNHAHVQNMRQQLWQFYGQHVSLYGSVNASMFRAITFAHKFEQQILLSIFEKAGYELDARVSVQPNLAKQLGLSELSNAMGFSSYLSLPLNSLTYQVVQKNGWLA